MLVVPRLQRSTILAIRLPALSRISCGTWWLWQTSCAFPYSKAHARPRPALRGRKSGFRAGLSLATGPPGLASMAILECHSSLNLPLARRLLPRHAGARRDDQKKGRRVLWYPTQAKIRLEWGT